MSPGTGVVVVLIVAVLALCALELVARSRLRAKLTGLSARVLGAPPAVTLARRPVLWQLAQRRLASVRVESRALAADAIRVSGRAHGLAPVPDGVHLGGLTATATLPLAWIRHTVDTAQAGSEADPVTVRSITLLPKTESVAVTVGLPVAFGLGVDLRVVIGVRVREGRIALRATDLSIPVSIVPVPIPIAWAIDSWVTQVRARVIPPAVDLLTIEALRWEREAVTLAISAEDVTVPLST